jgi:WD repeat and SOF domain-containing protein 1
MDDWKYIYVEQPNSTPPPSRPPLDGISERKGIIRSEHEAYLDEGFTKSRHADWEPPLVLPPPDQYRLYSAENSCGDDPRLFHMYWTGPFTDKPYLAVLSFLFTQNTGLHLAGEEGFNGCTPKLWIWINPGPAAALSDSATDDLFEQLKTSVWAAPFLHPRFKNIIHFKLWNTAEQLNSIPETRDDWRSKKTLFKSGPDGVVAIGSDQENNALVNRTGSQSADLYDKLSVIMSDMARFILCHR